MRMFVLSMLSLALALLVSSCGQFECSRTDMNGTYLTTYTRVSGNCTTPRKSISIYKNGESVDDAASDDDDTICQIGFERWSDDECQYETAGTCINQTDNVAGTLSVMVNQEDPGGELFTGIMSIEVRDLRTNDLICSGTYELTYERQ